MMTSTTVVAAQILGDEGAHDGGAHHGEQRGAQGDDAHDLAPVLDEPVGGHHEAGELEAHGGAAHHKDGHRIQRIVAVHTALARNHSVDGHTADSGNAVGGRNAQAAQRGQDDAGDQGFLDAHLDEQGAIDKGQHDADQVTNGQRDQGEVVGPGGKALNDIDVVVLQTGIHEVKDDAKDVKRDSILGKFFVS